MRTEERYWAVGTHDRESMFYNGFGDGVEFHDRIEEAVRDYDQRHAAGETDTRIFVMRPIDDADLYDWGVSSDAISAPSEYVNERAARSIAAGLTGGKVWRRRIGADTWEQVAEEVATRG